VADVHRAALPERAAAGVRRAQDLADAGAVAGVLDLALYLAVGWLDKKIVSWRAKDSGLSKLR